MMSKTERAVVQRLINYATTLGRSYEVATDRAYPGLKEAVEAAEKLLGPEPKLKWVRQQRGLWRAPVFAGAFYIRQDAHHRAPFEILHSGVFLGTAESLPKAKAYCEQKAQQS